MPKKTIKGQKFKVSRKGPTIDIHGTDADGVVAALEEVLEMIKAHPDALNKAGSERITFERIDSGFTMDLAHRS